MEILDPTIGQLEESREELLSKIDTLESRFKELQKIHVKRLEELGEQITKNSELTKLLKETHCCEITERGKGPCEVCEKLSLNKDKN